MYIEKLFQLGMFVSVPMSIIGQSFRKLFPISIREQSKYVMSTRYVGS